MRVEVSAGERTISTGTLGEFRTWTRDGLTLDDGEKRTLELRAWLPEGGERNHEGVILDATVELRAEVRR